MYYSTRWTNIHVACSSSFFYSSKYLYNFVEKNRCFKPSIKKNIIALYHLLSGWIPEFLRMGQYCNINRSCYWCICTKCKSEKEKKRKKDIMRECRIDKRINKNHNWYVCRCIYIYMYISNYLVPPVFIYDFTQCEWPLIKYVI